MNTAITGLTLSARPRDVQVRWGNRLVLTAALVITALGASVGTATAITPYQWRHLQHRQVPTWRTIRHDPRPVPAYCICDPLVDLIVASR